MRIAPEHNGPAPTAPCSGEIGHERRLVWSEHLEPNEVASGSVLSLLARYQLEVAVAIRPGPRRGLAHLLKAAADRGVAVHLWPMLSDADGRWLSERNASAFEDFVERLVGDAESVGVRPRIVLDLEPPIDLMRRWLRNPSRILVAARRRPTRVSRLLQMLHRRGIEPWATVVPLVAADPPDGPGGWHTLLGTPADPSSVHALNAMLYSSLAVGYTRGVLRRQDAKALLFEAARACARRWGPRAAASVGAVGPGALGDERTYADPAELAEDVALVRAAGIEDIGLFELRGVLRRPPAESWLDALCHTEPAIDLPHRSRRALAAIGLALGLGRLLASP